MIKSSVIEILKTFSDGEITGFGDFIETPYHNKNAKIIKLFSLLKKYHPDYSDVSLTKENLFGKLAGNVKYKDSYIRNLLSDLNSLAETFLQLKCMLRNNTSDRLLIEELINRDLNEITKKKIKAFEKQIESNKARDQEYYMNRNFIHEMKSFLVVDKTLTDSFRKEQISNIINQFVISLTENSFYLLLEEQRVKIKHNFDFLRYILQFVKNDISSFNESPLLIIYYHLWTCFLFENKDEHFYKAREYFQKHFKSFSKVDKKNIYSVMQIYYINKIDNGANSYNKEFLRFLLEMIKFNILSHTGSGNINLNLYRNIMVLSSMEKETKILKSFISKYINFVNKENRDSVLAYSNAHLYYLQNNFEKSLELCSKINFSDFLPQTNDNLYFKNDIKSLTLKCLYELNLFEPALSFIDSYKHFIRNSKLIKEEVKKKYLNFLFFTNSLIKLKLSFDEYYFESLINKLKKCKDVMHENWIKEKMNQLKP